MADENHTTTIIITTVAPTTTTSVTTTSTTPVTAINDLNSTDSSVATSNGANKRLLRLFCKKKGQNAFCCVPTCKNSSKKNLNLHFHTFPKDDKTIMSGERCGENLRKVWLSQIRRLTFR